MTTPCGQEAKIAKIETTLDHVVTLLDKHEEREDSMLSAMNKVASQTEVLHAHAATLDRHETAIVEAFRLIREHISEAVVEDKTKNLFVRAVENTTVAAVFAGVVLTGFIIDIIEHSKTVKQIIEWLRG